MAQHQSRGSFQIDCLTYMGWFVSLPRVANPRRNFTVFSQVMSSRPPSQKALSDFDFLFSLHLLLIPCLLTADQFFITAGARITNWESLKTTTTSRSSTRATICRFGKCCTSLANLHNPFLAQNFPFNFFSDSHGRDDVTMFILVESTIPPRSSRYRVLSLLSVTPCIAKKQRAFSANGHRWNALRKTAL